MCERYEIERARFQDQVQALKVVDLESENIAVALGARCRQKMKEIEDEERPIIDKLYRLHKAALAKLKKKQEPYDSFLKSINGKLTCYRDRVERERREAERLAFEEARRKAQAERDAELERQRKDAEKLAEDAKTKAEAKRIKAEAKRLETAIASTPLAISPTLPPAPVLAKGTTTRKTWKWKLVNPQQVKPLFLSPDNKKIGKIVLAMGQAAADIVGGIEVFEEAKVSIRGKR